MRPSWPLMSRSLLRLSSTLMKQASRSSLLISFITSSTASPSTLTTFEKNTQKSKAVFPCALKIIPQYIFNRQNPIVVGVDVQQGILKPNTPLFVLRKEEVEVKSEVVDDNMIDDSEKAPEQKKMKTV